MDQYDKFKSITGYDIRSFFQAYVDFCNNNYPHIVDFYQGGEINADSFYVLDKLIAELNVIEPLFRLHANSLDDISMWDILDMFSEIQTKLLTIKNSDKWLRSAAVNRTNTIQLQKQLRTGETFESAAEQVGYQDPEDEWMGIVTPQYIIEEDYVVNEGSNTFAINLKNTGVNYVETVVDTLVDDHVLGKDFSIEFVFKDNDLKIVEYGKAIEQSLSTILQSIRGCVPEFSDYGLPTDFIGTTVNAIQYPSIFKALMNMFQRDGRWESVELLDIKKKEDSVFLKVKATTVAKEDFLVNVPI